MVPGPRREGRAVRGHRQRRQGLPHRGRQGQRLLRRARARGPRPRGGPGRPLYVGTSPDGKVYAVDAGGQGRRPSSIPTTSTSGPWPSTRRATCSWPPGPRARSTAWTAKGKADDPPRPARDPHHRPSPSTAKGNVYAGSAPGGILYRIDARGQGLRPPRLALPRGEGARRRPGRQRLRRPRRRQGRATRPRPRPRPPPTPAPARPAPR